LRVAGTFDRMRLEPHPTTRRDVDVNRAPSGCADGHQPRFHGPGAGMLCCQQPLVRSDARAVSRTQPSAHRHLFTDARARSPSRATGRDLYPNPIRSDTSRHETGASSGGDSDGARRRSGQELRLRRSHHTSPTPAKGRSPRAPDTSCCGSRLRVDPPCSASLEAKGRISRASAKKNEIRCTRGAFHR
jgi:hypothetical protein